LIETRIFPFVLGRDARCIAGIKHDLEFQLHNFGRIGPIIYGIAAVDIALWDILGKAARVPLVQLLGGQRTDEIEAYASLMRYGNVPDVVAATERAVSRGYKYIKLHEITMPEIRASVEAAGKSARVMLDTNCPWTVPEAMQHSASMADFDLLWLEEPVWPPENYVGLRLVRELGHQRIAAGENAGSLHDFVAMIEAGAIDIAQPDVAKSGGLTEVLKIAHLCEAHGIEFMPHCALFGPGQLATIHLSATMKPAPLFERLFCDFEEELWGEATIPKNGRVSVPVGPGLGLEPLPGVVEKYQI